MSQKRHLLLRGRVWQYNRAYPADLEETLGKAPFRKSLGTNSFAEALRAKPEAEREYWAKVDAARAKSQRFRKGVPVEAEAQSLAVHWFRESISLAEDALEFEQRGPDRLEWALENAINHLGDRRRELSEDGGSKVAWDIAQEAALSAGFEGAGPLLPRLVQRARIALAEVWKARLLSDYGLRPGDPLFAAAMVSPQGPSQVQEKVEPDQTLSELIDAFKAAQWDDLKPAGRASYSRVFMVLEEILGGSLPLARIDRTEARKVFDKVKALPSG